MELLRDGYCLPLCGMTPGLLGDHRPNDERHEKRQL